MPRRSRQTQVPKGGSGRVIKSRGGVSHGKRNSRDKTQAKKAARKEDSRVVQSAEQVREHQRQIDELASPAEIAARTEFSGKRGHSRCTPKNCTWYQPNCPVREDPGIDNVELPEVITYPNPVKAALRLPNVARDAEGPGKLGDARRALREGYHISHVIRRYGWGFNHLKDLIDGDGYVKEDEAW